MVSLALYQPDIPQNAGTILRLAACLSLEVHIIEPAGFVWSEKQFRRSGMDYLRHVEVVRHNSFGAFMGQKGGARIVLLTTQGAENYTECEFDQDDILLLGRESAGVPQDVHDIADARVKIPMAPDARSLNVAVSCAMVVGEALRQTNGFPPANPLATPSP
ncbi:MAG: tRNA (cytidine(34)-2'-O)-methyltransferase [Hyphomicrobiales bacterium]